MFEKPNRHLSLFRLPRIPIKDILKPDQKGFIDYSLTELDGSWEAKDALGCQLFWVELDNEPKTGSVAELVGIFGERIASLRRESQTSNRLTMRFTDSLDAPMFETITFTTQPDETSRSMVITLLPRGSAEPSVYAWKPSTPQTWALHPAGDANLVGTFNRQPDGNAKVSFPQTSPPNTLGPGGDGVDYLCYSV
ncbi:hypothetical protein L0F63_004470 [Massospora cicadina]|nr:hypothetical protein L0F63_004470 [Massospora cicadina]